MDTTPELPMIPNRRKGASRARLLDRVRAEFREMPCLRLTRGQAQRLFGMRADVCERVFATLVGDGTLTCGPDARYGVRAEVTWLGHMSSAAAGGINSKAS
jgi:hypothetical protein